MNKRFQKVISKMLPSDEIIMWRKFHDRILNGDPTAFAELCEVGLAYLTAFLRKNFPESDADMYETIAIDTLLKYQESPEKYNPDKSNLQTFLCMDAKGDMLNEIEKQRRRNRKIVPMDDEIVELEFDNGNNEQGGIDDWLVKYTSYSRDQLLQELSNELTPVDEQIVISMAEGIRDTDHYAKIMSIEHLSDEEKKREVKRAKDRIKKKLERFGKHRGK